MKQSPGKTGLDACADEGNGVFRVDWTATPITHMTWWIDTSRGFTSIRLERRYRLPELGETEWRDPHETHDVTWEQIDDVWVPSTYRVFKQLELTPDKPPKPTDYKYTPRYRKFTYRYTFQWESVNETVDERYFDYEDFDVPDGTYVADARSGELEILEVVGNPVTEPRDLSRSPTPSWTWTRVVAVLTGGFFLLFLATLVWRRKRS